MGNARLCDSVSWVTGHSRALTRVNCMAGREPAKRGHCTPDGPERPKEECCPSPAGSAGKLGCRWCVLVVQTGLWEAAGTREAGKCIVEECVHLCVDWPVRENESK